MRSRDIQKLEDKRIFWDERIEKYLRRLMAAYDARRDVDRRLNPPDPEAAPDWNPADLVDLSTQNSTKKKRKLAFEVLMNKAIDARRGPFAGDIIHTPAVQDFFSRNMSDLTSGDLYEIKMLVSAKSYPLPQEQYRIPNHPFSGESHKTRQVRLKCIRNPEKWTTAKRGQVVNEFLRETTNEKI